MAQEVATAEPSHHRLMTRNAAQRAAPSIAFAFLVWAMSRRLTPSHGLLTYGDYPYYWPVRANDGFSVIQSSFLGNIRLVGMNWMLPIQLSRILAKILPASWVAYLLTYGLVYLTCLVYYFTALRMTRSRAISFVAGLFIVVNSVVLQYMLYQPSHIFAALIAYALTLRVFLLADRDGLRGRHALMLAGISLLITHPFLWMLEIFLLAALFALLALKRRPFVRGALTTFCLVVLLAAYWIVPFFAGLVSSTTAQIYAGNQEAIFNAVRDKVHFREALSLTEYQGTWDAAYGGWAPHVFYVYFVAVAFAVGVFLLWGRRGPNRRWFLFFLALYAAAIALGLGPNSMISGRAWMFAYQHVPGFGFFRTFTRFINLAVFALVFLVVLSLSEIRRFGRRALSVATAAAVSMIVLSNIPFFTGDFNGTTGTANVPDAYMSLNRGLLDAGEDFTVVTYPNIGYEAYDWSANRNQVGFPQITYFKELFLRESVVFNRFALTNLNLDNDYLPRLLAFDSDFSFYPGFDSDLNKIDAKYVLVHKDLFDILKVVGGTAASMSNADAMTAAKVPYERYVDYFSHNGTYRVVEDNAHFAVFENLGFRPRVRGPSVSYQKLNESTYRIFVSNLAGPRELQLLQRFEPGWRLYVQRHPSQSWCQPVARFADGLTQCAEGSGSPQLSDVRRLAQTSLRAPHSTALGYANAWTIDPAVVRRDLSKRSYATNPDGSINVELIAYFRPQSYFYLGLLITIVTTLGCAGAAVVVAIRWRKDPGRGTLLAQSDVTSSLTRRTSVPAPEDSRV